MNQTPSKQSPITVTVTDHARNKGVTVLSVKGVIDTLTAPEFETHLRTVLESRKYNLLIDLKEVDYISSAGWGIFISEIKHIRKNKGDLYLTGMSAEVYDIYELLGFQPILKAFPDVETAVKHGFGKA